MKLDLAFVLNIIATIIPLIIKFMNAISNTSEKKVVIDAIVDALGGPEAVEKMVALKKMPVADWPTLEPVENVLEGLKKEEPK